MKEGLEKYFEGDQQAPQELPEVEATPQEPVAQEAPEIVEEVVEAPVAEEQPIEQAPVEEVIEQPILEVIEEPKVEETIAAEAPKSDIPEGVDSLIKFMKETGKGMEEYLKLNRSYDDLDDRSVLKEYYKQTKTHLDDSDINFLINKKLDISEDLDELEARERKIALKEELSQAKRGLQKLKDDYYTEIKSNTNYEYEAQLEAQKANAQLFQEKTDKYFEGFEGFSFEIGDGKKMRYKVDNVSNLKNQQSSLDNVFGRFLNEGGQVEDVEGLHLSMFAAANPHKIAQLFYQQGKADAIEAQAKDSKNLDFKHQTQAPTSTQKLAPGTAREIEQPTVGPRIKLKGNYSWNK